MRLPAVRIIGRWGDYRIGDVITPPASLRNYLLILKVAEPVDEACIAPVQTSPPKSAPTRKPKGKKRK